MLADVVRRATGGIVLPEPGEPFMGGFFVGVMDTTHSNIIAGDQYQDGLRYALIVSPKSLEASPTRWALPADLYPEAQTRWDGLSSQRNCLAVGDNFAVFEYCDGLEYPDDGGSEWYTPALDEMELVYRNLKPTTQNNAAGNRSGEDFPGGTITPGENPSSDPAGDAYTASDPSQTAVTAFQDGGGEDIANSYTSTVANSSQVWAVLRGNGNWTSHSQTTGGGLPVRPVRRVEI